MPKVPHNMPPMLWTPGDWQVAEWSDPGTGSYHVRSWRDTGYADVLVTVNTSLTSEERKANATLASASPDLARAAVAAINHLQACEAGRIRYPFTSTSLPMLVAAVEKAIPGFKINGDSV